MFLFFLFAKLSLEAHCHAFVTVEETKRQLGQSATSVSYRLLLLEKGTKMKIDNGCEIFLATETITIFVFYLPINNCYHIIHALITSRVDYCNSLLYGLPATQLNKIQRLLNAAARLVCRSPRYCHITPLMYNLHWLPVNLRIRFKVLLFEFKAIHSIAPYISDLISVKPNSSYNLPAFIICRHFACVSIPEDEANFRWLVVLSSCTNTMEWTSTWTLGLRGLQFI